MRLIVDRCKETGKRYKTVPVRELIDGEISLATLRDVSTSVRRDEVKLDMISFKTLGGKRVLITGAGGSIGSELVIQCLNFNPVEIICFDINEENL